MLVHSIGANLEARLVRNAPGGVAATGFMGAGGSGAGQLGGPLGVMVHDNVVYISESINGRVSVFSASNFEFRGTIGTEGSGEGQFRTPFAIAMDEEAGAVYVSDEKLCRVSAHRWF